MPYIEYPSAPDPLDRRRLDRSRFAACCLPVAATALLLGALLLWFGGQLAHIRKPLLPTQLGNAAAVFGLAAYALLYAQYRLLDRRCNDYGGAWQGNAILHGLGTIPALGAGFSLTLSALWWLLLTAQYGLGLALPSQAHGNLSGPRPPAPTGMVRAAAWGTLGLYGAGAACGLWLCR